MPKGHVNPPPEIRARFGKNVKVCTRAVAAFILGISRAEFRRREKDGLYPACIDDRGRAWFDEENIRRIAGDVFVARSESVGRPRLVKKEKDLVKNVRKHGYDAKTAALVFAELRAGKSLEEIVVEKEVHPDEAFAIYEAWIKIRATILLTKEHLDQMAHLPLRGGWPPMNADQFVLMIRGTVECGANKCAKCKSAYARLCTACVPKPAATVSNGHAHATGSVVVHPADAADAVNADGLLSDTEETKDTVNEDVAR